MTLCAAQHEAAHVVVGVALGLKLRKACVGEWARGEGYCWFPMPPGKRTYAWAISTAAGVAWERAIDEWRDSEGPQRHDWALLREWTPSLHDAETCVRSAAALLSGLGAVHARVTRGLLERALSGADVLALARGERLQHDD